MSFDTKYRPETFSDVLGQDSIVKVLKAYLKGKAGFHQSYLFAGPYGSGKTTLARILARALLCDNLSPEYEPCNQCDSCKDILTKGYSDAFVEVDAATNSGKDSVLRITEDIQLLSFSGKKRIYLFDEAHQMSKDALDALLKPLEDNVPGTKDKKLVCIFCTTEPEKMRSTILSRCAPAFVVKPLTVEALSGRLSWVCNQENIKFDNKSLDIISESVELHVRDALKALEAISLHGSINLENTKNYFNLDIQDMYIDILLNADTDIKTSLSLVKAISDKMSAATLYLKLVDVCLIAYNYYLSVAKPSFFWDADKIKALSEKGDLLLLYASKLASRPQKVTYSMLMCDIATLTKNLSVEVRTEVINNNNASIKSSVKETPAYSQPALVRGVYVDPRAQKKIDPDQNVTAIKSENSELTVDTFREVLNKRLSELKVSSNGSKGQT
jgi:DNA polymerase III subunit gamma/tau